MSEQNTQVAKQQEFTTALSQYSSMYTDLIAQEFEGRGLKFDDYSKTCAMAAMSAIFDLVQSDENLEMEKLNRSNLRNVICTVSSLKLNANAVPRECFFSSRKKKIGNAWTYTIEVGIEGDGNDALLRNFGVDVKKVYPYWCVKEGDEFTFPKHVGLEVQPPTWEPRGVSNKTVRVVYPVQLSDRVEYLMADRDSVKTNLISHIKQNMMNETFGICADRYKATQQQKEEIKQKKNEYLNIARSCETVEDIIACKELQKWISGAWLDTPEEMIVRKMRNNAIKKFSKNMNSIANESLQYIEENKNVVDVQEYIETNANSKELIIEEETQEEVVVEDVQETSEQKVEDSKATAPF